MTRGFPKTYLSEVDMDALILTLSNDYSVRHSAYIELQIGFTDAKASIAQIMMGVI
jgi:hypothetical protein